MGSNSKVTSAIDGFIPSELLGNREMRTRARMFLLSHLFGPVLGNVIPAYLMWLDPESAWKLLVLGGAITGFWLFPALLKYTGKYVLLSYISIQNLLLAILWGCYFYGGLSSPFLPWLVTVPLLAFFYLGASVRTCLAVLALIGTNIGAFIFLFASAEELPHSIALVDMQGIGLISIFSASIYVSMMALYYARILASQNEFEKLVSDHMQTAAELRAAVSQAERASQAKAEFLAKMSHELRTPLNAVIGYSQMLLEETEPSQDPQGVEDLGKIHDAGHHLLGLVNSILDLSKIEAGRMQLFPETIEIVGFLHRLIERWSADRRLGLRRILLDASPGVEALRADPLKLEQVLDALLDNAIRYADGDIHIAAVPKDDRIEIKVSDEGAGIPPELLPRIFDTFSDAADASTSKYGGAGLGLPLSYRLCRLMQADLSVDSPSGEGSTIRLSLPADLSNGCASEPAPRLPAAA